MGSHATGRHAQQDAAEAKGSLPAFPGFEQSLLVISYPRAILAVMAVIKLNDTTLAVMAVVKLRRRSLRTTPNDRVTPCRGVGAFH